MAAAGSRRSILFKKLFEISGLRALAGAPRDWHTL
jgi:hypothetical protein